MSQEKEGEGQAAQGGAPRR